MPEYKNVHGFDDANLKVKTVDYDEFKDHETRMQQKIDSIDVTSSADFNLLKSQVSKNTTSISNVNNSLTTNVNNINYKISNEQKYREQGDQALKARLDKYTNLIYRNAYTPKSDEVGKWKRVTWEYGITFDSYPMVAPYLLTSNLDARIIMEAIEPTFCRVLVYYPSAGTEIAFGINACGFKK